MVLSSVHVLSSHGYHISTSFQANSASYLGGTGNTGQSAVMLCGWMADSVYGLNVRVAGTSTHQEMRIMR